MLIVVGTRKRPDGNLKAMFLLLDLWKKGVRDSFFDANITEKKFEKVCLQFGRDYVAPEQAYPNEEKEEENRKENEEENKTKEKKELVHVPKNTLIVEAEAAAYLDNGVKIVEDAEASEGKAIDSARGARAIHEIYIPKTGKWYVWIRAHFKAGNQDSYWVGIDDVEPYPWDEQGGPNAIKIWAVPGDSSKWHRWLWDTSTHPRGKSIPGYFRIKRKGYYRLWSKGREPGSHLDQILLTRSRRFNPETASEGRSIPVITTPHPYEPITFEEGQRLINHAVEISKETETEFPWEFKYWLDDMWGDVRKFPEIEGSLYKCPKCGQDLPQQAVDLMKQHAHSDDIQFYILCRKCGVNLISKSSILLMVCWGCLLTVTTFSLAAPPNPYRYFDVNPRTGELTPKSSAGLNSQLSVSTYMQMLDECCLARARESCNRMALNMCLPSKLISATNREKEQAQNSMNIYLLKQGCH